MLAFSEMLKSPVKRMMAKRPISKQILEKGFDLFAIVLSIYLALSIEGWAEKRNEHNRLGHYYENISSELAKDTVSLSEIVAFTRKQVETTNGHLKMLKYYKPEYEDTIAQLYRNMLSAQLFGSSSMVSYQSMIVSGDIKLIESLEIRGKLIELDEEYKSLKIWEDLCMDFFRADLMDSYFTSFDLLEMKLLINDYFMTPSYRNLVVKYYSLNQSRLDETEKTLVKAKEVLAVIMKQQNEK
jgi:hypothetical protein